LNPRRAILATASINGNFTKALVLYPKTIRLCSLLSSDVGIRLN
jgi:hypothetical protein